MDLDQTKTKALIDALWDLWNDCRFVGYDLTKDKYRNQGLLTLDDIVGHGNYRALRTNTEEFEDRPVNIKNALHQIDRLKMHYAKVLEGLDYFEGVLKELDHE